MSRYFYDLNPTERAPFLVALHRSSRELARVTPLLIGVGFAALTAFVLYVFTSTTRAHFLDVTAIVFTSAMAIEWWRQRIEVRRIYRSIEAVAKELEQQERELERQW